jgi:hypothetical protein
MNATREWIPPLWLALLLACAAATVATVAAFVVGGRAGAVPGAIAIVLFTAAFRRSGRSVSAQSEPVESSMLDALLTAARDLAQEQQTRVIEQLAVLVPPERPPDERAQESSTLI